MLVPYNYLKYSLAALPMLLLSCQSIEPKALTPLQQQQLEEEARAHIKPFAKDLLSAVSISMKQNGPVKTIEVCQLIAPSIANTHSAQQWEIGRTSLKLRNPDNAPDSWEKSVLEKFAKQVNNPDTPMLSESTYQDGTYRYMQAIKVGQPCLACHGEQVNEDVLQELKLRYPADQAVGYKLGEVRGAFTLKKRLNLEDISQIK